MDTKYLRQPTHAQTQACKKKKGTKKKNMNIFISDPSCDFRV